MKKYLLAPGPTQVSPEVLLALAQPILHHRAPEFAKILERVKQDLKWLYQTQNDVLILASSGTGGMEGSVTNFLSPGDKALVVNGGKFGERWLKICQAYGVKTEEIKVEWGYGVKPDQIKAALQKDPTIKAVFTQANETSTGVAHPIREIGEIVKGFEGTLMVVAPRSSSTRADAGFAGAIITEVLMISPAGSSPDFFKRPITASSPRSDTRMLSIPSRTARRTSSRAYTS